MKKQTKDKKLVNASLIDMATNKGISRVKKARDYNVAQDKIRAVYGSEVMKAVIFNLDHPLKEEFLKEMEDLKNDWEGNLLEDSLSADGKYVYSDEELKEMRKARILK